jgi:hypothetical protein
MSALDRIVEDNIDLIAGEVFEGDGDDARMMMSSSIVEQSVHHKKASSVFSRIQQPEVEMHQDVVTPDFWKISKNKLVRIVPHVVKG